MGPHRWQPTRLPCPWDSPGKNTWLGCHFLLQCMKGKCESEGAQSCPTQSNPMDCSPPDFSIHGIFLERGLESGAIAFSSFSLLMYNLRFLWCLSEMVSISRSYQLILDKSLSWPISWERNKISNPIWLQSSDYTYCTASRSPSREKKFIRLGKSICFPKKCHPQSLK